MRFLGCLAIGIACIIIFSLLPPTSGKIFTAILLLVGGIGILWDRSGGGPGDTPD